jgi:2Fe-2S ferredoxin
MINIYVTDADGAKKELTATSGSQLMNTIRDAGIVEGTCGGMASCGTCHVYIDDAWNALTGERTEDEGYMLESLEELVEIKSTSRLCCQIILSEDHDGLSLTVGPQI